MKTIWDELNNINDEEIQLNEMTTVGHFLQKKSDTQNKTGFKVTVTSDNYSRAHIHCRQVGDGRDIKRVCVDIVSPSYFKHDKWVDNFDNDEAKAFDKFLRSPYKYPQIFRIDDNYYNVETNWQYAIYQWKLENDGVKDNIPLKINENSYAIFPEQPDYKNLNN